jgi:hypothetical protein
MPLLGTLVARQRINGTIMIDSLLTGATLGTPQHAIKVGPARGRHRVRAR